MSCRRRYEILKRKRVAVWSEDVEGQSGRRLGYLLSTNEVVIAKTDAALNKAKGEDGDEPAKPAGDAH